MKCPKCQSRNLYVTDSRDTVRKNEIRRRRKCAECGYRFTTHEQLQTDLVAERLLLEANLRDSIIHAITQSFKKSETLGDILSRKRQR